MSETKIFFRKCGLANVFIIVGEKTIIVDAGLDGSTDKILNLLEENNIKKEDVSLILITHAHPDHCLNVKDLKETLNVPVAISAIEAHYLEEGTFAPVKPRTFAGKIIYKLLHSLHKSHNKTISPEIRFDKELDLNQFGVEGKVLLTPGHTLGSSSVFLDNGLCVISDMLLQLPMSKKPKLSLSAVNMDLLRQSIKEVILSNSKFLYTSHGEGWDMGLIKKVILPKL